MVAPYRSCRSVTANTRQDRRDLLREAADLWLIESMALPADFFSRYVERVAKTTPDDCTRLVRQTVDPDKLVIVVVGDAEKVKQDLEKIAPVTVVKE